MVNMGICFCKKTVFYGLYIAAVSLNVVGPLRSIYHGQWALNRNVFANHDDKSRFSHACFDRQ